jgi:nicotinamidase-related amidase
MMMLSIDDSVLVLIDVQEKLFRLMDDKDAVLQNLQKLVKGMNALGIPVIVTEQNPKGLGVTLPELTVLLADSTPISKMYFSCMGEPAFTAALDNVKRKQVLLCGIEAHVCVYQTAHDLLNKGYGVHVIANCISSREKINKETALREMERKGVLVSSTEMVLFEMLRTAEHPRFKDINKIVR